MLIDSHCHIPHEKYDKSVDEILSEAAQEGVTKVITVGTSLKDSAEVLKVGTKYDQIFSAIGVYPHEDIGEDLDIIHDEIRANLNHHRKQIVAIGECGIDIPEAEVSYKTRELSEQIELFKLQIGLAIERDLPIVIHNRNGNADVLEILDKYKHTTLRGVAHCFTGDWEFAQKLLDLNFYVSFSGIATFPSAGADLLEVIKKVPGDRYLVETDAPYLAPQGHRGETCYPKYVKITAEKVAEIRNESFDKVAQETFQNTSQLFNL